MAHKCPPQLHRASFPTTLPVSTSLLPSSSWSSSAHPRAFASAALSACSALSLTPACLLPAVAGFMRQVDWATWCHNIGSNIVRNAPVSVFLDKINAENSQLPSPAWVGLIQSVQSLDRTKGCGRGNSSWLTH